MDQLPYLRTGPFSQSFRSFCLVTPFAPFLFPVLTRRSFQSRLDKLGDRPDVRVSTKLRELVKRLMEINEGSKGRQNNSLHHKPSLHSLGSVGCSSTFHPGAYG
jgi:hypothetical protein